MIKKIFKKPKYNIFLGNDQIIGTEISENEKNNKFLTIAPPPNITNNLHHGHALELFTSQIVCNKEGKENSILSIGSDHAGIATELMIKKEFSEVTLGNSLLFETRNRNKIQNQIQLLNLESADHNNFYFTKDAIFLSTIDELLIKLKNLDLIYGGKYLINWCPNCKTGLSDLEVDSVKTENNFYFYDYTTNLGNIITIGTNRPETFFWDNAIVSKNTIKDKFVVHPITKKQLPIIVDSAAFKEEIGTSFFKLTANFAKKDLEIATKHKILFEKINYLDENNKFIDLFLNQTFESLAEYRIEVLKHITLNKTIKIFSFIPKCYRCKQIIEKKFSNELFLNIKKAFELFPINNTVYFPKEIHTGVKDWANNIEEWCLTRTLKYGIKPKICWCYQIINLTPNHSCVCQKKVWDTWFSSALVTVVISRIYKQKNISSIITGKDLIYFWIERMLLFQRILDPEIKVKKIFFHGLIRDSNGDKLSKTKGNYQTLPDIVQQYGIINYRLHMILNQRPFEDFRLNLEDTNNATLINKVLKKITLLDNYLQKNYVGGENIYLYGSFKSIIVIYKQNISNYIDQLNIKQAFLEWHSLFQEFNYLFEMHKKNSIQYINETFIEIINIFKWFVPEQSIYCETANIQIKKAKNNIYFEAKLNYKIMFESEKNQSWDKNSIKKKITSEKENIDVLKSTINENISKGWNVNKLQFILENKLIDVKYLSFLLNKFDI